MERRQDREEEGAGEEGERQVHAVLPLASACLKRKKMKSRKFADFGAASQKRRSCQGCQDRCRSSRSDEQRRELLQMKELWKMCTLLRTTDSLCGEPPIWLQHMEGRRQELEESGALLQMFPLGNFP